MDNSETKDNSSIVEVRSAKQLYDEKILASLVGTSYPAHLQNLCLNSRKFKLERFGTKEQRPGIWTGLECEAGEAKDKLGFCESCMTFKYMRNFNDTV